MQAREEDERQGSVAGLWYAEVQELDEEGYILKWLSGNVGSLSAPARIATMMAGDGRGTFFMPEVGDEVVVGFEEGDLDQPVILGALWSDTDSPPEDTDTSKSNNIRTMVSRSKHQLTFDDSPGSGKVIIKTNANLQIILDDAASSITLEVDGGNKIEISPAGVTITGTIIDLNP
jgi:uncharacterized protein involved in type VI secretion and phage assembly